MKLLRRLRRCGTSATPAPSPAPTPTPTPTAGVIPDISPGVGWLLTPDSASVTFVDPPRTTAKPGLRMMTDGGYRSFDSTDLIIGVQAFANGGLSSVQCEIEGNIYTVPLSTYTYTDANGVSRTDWGYFARLDHSAWSGNGDANVRWKATPSDGTQQARVIGPFRYTRVTTLYDVDITVAASGAGGAYTTLQAARIACRAASANNARITITETGTYYWGDIGTEYAGGKSYCQITHAPGVTATLRVLAALAYPYQVGTKGTADNTGRFYLDYNGIELRGSGIKIDHDYMTAFYQSFGTNMGTKPLFLNGCEIYCGTGRFTLRNSRLTEAMLAGNPVGGAVALEVTMRDMMNAFVGQGQANAVSWIALRNNTVHDIAGDVTQLVNTFYGMTCYNVTCADYRTPVAAMTLRYNGTDAAATFHKVGFNMDPAAGTLVLKSGPIGATTTQLIVDLTFQKTVQTVVNEINAALSGSNWVAATSAGHATWDAAALYDGIVQGFGPSVDSGGAIAPRDVKGITYQIYTAIDAHGDIVQPSTGQAVENLVFTNLTGYDIKEAQHFFLTDQGSNGAFDVFLVNYAAAGVPPGGGFTAHFDGKVRNLNIWNSVFSDMEFIVDTAVDTDTYCSIKNSVFKTFTKSGTFLGSIDGNHFVNGAPTGATNSTTGSTIAALLTSASTGDFSAKSGGTLASRTSLASFDRLGATRSASSHIGSDA